MGHLCLYAFFPQADVVIQHPPVYRTATVRLWPRRSSGLPVPPLARSRMGADFEEFADGFFDEMLVSTTDHAAQYGTQEI